MQGNQHGTTQTETGLLTDHTFEDGIVVEEMTRSGYILRNRTDDTEHESIHTPVFHDAALIVYGSLVVFSPVTVTVERDDQDRKVAHIEVEDE